MWILDEQPPNPYRDSGAIVSEIDRWIGKRGHSEFPDTCVAADDAQYKRLLNERVDLYLLPR